MPLCEAPPADVLSRNRLTFSAWGGRLTVDQYLAREARLRDTAFARAGMRTWLFLDDTGAVLASCETYRMPSALHGAHGFSVGIASVFVEAQLRGRGAAGSMIHLVTERMKAEGAQAVILFSEVGEGIYARCGFIARPMHARRWPALPGEAQTFSRHLLPTVLSDIAAGPFRIIPSLDQVEWHLERAAFYHGVLAPSLPSPDGAVGAQAADGWIVWAPDYKAGKLMVLHASTSSDLLVRAAQHTAHRLGLSEVEAWESIHPVLPGGETAPIPDEIPMILPLHPGLQAEHWLHPGRGCWM